MMQLPRPHATIANLVNLIGGLVVVYLVVLLGQTIKRNFDLGNQISRLQVQAKQLQAQTDELSNRIQYYQTNSFREREARAKLGLQLPGESVIIIPQTTTSPSSLPGGNQRTKHPASHFSQWLNFLLGRPL
jgi:cell division protein FtsB